MVSTYGIIAGKDGAGVLRRGAGGVGTPFRSLPGCYRPYNFSPT